MPADMQVLGELCDFDTATEPPRDSSDNALTVLGLVELLLKDPERLDELGQDPGYLRELFPRLVLVAEAGYGAFALAIALLCNLAPAGMGDGGLLPLPATAWVNGSALGLLAAYLFGPFLAAGVCLPSFYFYNLLAGVRMSWLQISTIVVRGSASAAVMLLGILPIYVAVVLGLVIFPVPGDLLQIALRLGLLLPLVSGLWGLLAIYRGIQAVTNAACRQWQEERGCFLRRLTFAWTAVYTAVLPVMIYRLWERISGF